MLGASSTMTLPNLVIAGAPKSGTTSVFFWLADHPEACGSSLKETNYLLDEGHPLQRPKANYYSQGLEGYRQFFGHCARDSEIVYEATPHYMYQETAPSVLSSLSPVPKIVFILRKPSARVFSSFQYTKNNAGALQRGLAFSAYVEAVLGGVADSLRDKFVPGHDPYILLNEIKYSQYTDYLERWADLIGREHLHVFLFEDMKRDAKAFMQRLSQCAGIDPGFYKDYKFAALNQTIQVRHLGLQRRIRKIANLVPRGELKDFGKAVYLRLQGGAAMAPVSEEDRAALRVLDNHYAPFNERLAVMFEVDVSAWD